VVTGALEPAARFLERVFKFNLQIGLLVSLVLAMLLSMGVNDTPVLVLLLPIFVTLAARGAMPASKTLIPLNAAVLIGGMATTIGTSTNILVVSIAGDLGMPPVGVFDFHPDRAGRGAGGAALSVAGDAAAAGRQFGGGDRDQAALFRTVAGDRG
jgi:Na+/H+ antiporter NhaD/arsenite permease-like protein